jgi:ketosteroid isomerase-like protein
MTDHPNAATARAGLEAFTKGDVAGLAALLDDGIVWHAPGESRYAGTFTGKGETMERMARMAQEGVVWGFDIHDVVGNDEHVVALIDATITKGDATARGPQVQVMHVRDGKMTEFWGYNQDQAAVDAVLNS